MICYKIKEGVNFCKSEHPKRWVQRIVIINMQDVNEPETITDGYRIIFKLKENQLQKPLRLSGKAFEYPNIFEQITGNAEAVTKFNTKYWRHNAQISLADFRNFERLNEINRSDFFAAMLDYKDRVWIFGFEYGLEPEDYLFQNTEMDTITLRSKHLESNPPLLYLGNVSDFWNNFTDPTELPDMGDFNDDFNDDFFNN